MKSILLIGGTTTQRALLRASLEAEGHHVSAAVTRKYTNRWLSRRIKPFDLIVYDLEEAAQEPGFWPELRAAAGQTPILMLASAFDPTDYAALGMNSVMRRPISVGDVVKEAQRLLA